jgi:PPP family 3-phenylpropionic acid transporter
MIQDASDPGLRKTFEQQYVALASSTFLLTFSTGCYSIFLGSFLSSRGVNGEDLGFIGAAGSAALIAGNLAWGFISDVTGRRRSLIILGSLISAPAMLLWLAGRTTAEYVALNAGFYFFVSPTIALVSVFILDLLPAEARARRFGGIRVWGSLGLLTASWGAGWFLRAQPDRLFVITAATSALGLLPFIAGTREVIRRGARRFHVRHVLLHRRLAVFFLCTALHGFWEPGAFLFLSYMLKQQNAPEGVIGVILGMNGLVAMISFPIAGHMADRWGRRPALLLMYLLTGIRMLLYSVISNPWAALPVQLLHFGSFGISEGVGSVYVSELADQRDRATALACFHVFHSVGALVGSLAGGYLVSSHGFPFMYRVFAAAMSVAAVIFLTDWKLDSGLEKADQAVGL